MASNIYITEFDSTSNDSLGQTMDPAFSKKRQLNRGLELSRNLTIESRSHPYKNAKSHPRLRSYIRKMARQRLSHANSVRQTLKAEEHVADLRINETEEYLGVLRRQKAIIQIQVSEAEEEIGSVRESLDSDEIPEISLSDDEDDASSNVYPPLSSDRITQMGTSSSDNSSNITSNIGNQSGSPNNTSILSKDN